MAGFRLREAEQLSLLLPQRWYAETKFLDTNRRRLPIIEASFDDVWRDKRASDHSADVALMYAEALGDRTERVNLAGE